MKTHRRSSRSLETRGVLRGFSIYSIVKLFCGGRAAAAMEAMRRFGTESLHPKSKN